MKRFPRGYYRLENGANVRHRVKDTGGTIYLRNTTGERLEASREEFAKATKVQHYRPTPTQLWANSEKAGQAVKTEPRFRELIHAMKRIEVFVESLVEFNYIQVDLRGYYGGSTTRKNFMGEPMREVIVERLAGEMALALAYSMIADESAAADVKAQKREKFEAWAKTHARKLSNRSGQGKFVSAVRNAMLPACDSNGNTTAKPFGRRATGMANAVNMPFCRDSVA